MKKVFIFLVFISLIANSLGASKLQLITLKDNSVIKGTVVEMKDGIYKVKTRSLGVIEINADSIVSISSGNNSPASDSGTYNRPQVRISEGLNSRNQAQRKSKIVPKYDFKTNNEETPSSNNLKFQQESVNSRVKSMMTDGNFLNGMMDLSGSQEMTEVMSDPEVMEAISNNDYDFLMNNDKMKSLMESSEIKEMLGGF